jgi:hypothetical protein
VVRTDPVLSVEECNAGTGAAYASVYLDLGFERLIRNKLGAKADTILTKKTAVECLRYFESIKREFNPYDPDCENDFEIPIRGAPEMPEIGLEEGHLKLSKSFLVEDVSNM